MNKLKLGTAIHLSILEIKNNYGKDSITCMSLDVLNTLPYEHVMMKFGNKHVPLKIDNIRNLNT